MKNRLSHLAALAAAITVSACGDEADLSRQETATECLAETINLCKDRKAVSLGCSVIGDKVRCCVAEEGHAFYTLDACDRVAKELARVVGFIPRTGSDGDIERLCFDVEQDDSSLDSERLCGVTREQVREFVAAHNEVCATKEECDLENQSIEALPAQRACVLACDREIAEEILPRTDEAPEM